MRHIRQINRTALGIWCPEPESNRHDRFRSRDFKSLASTNFAIRAREGSKRKGLEAGVGIEPA